MKTTHILLILGLFLSYSYASLDISYTTPRGGMDKRYEYNIELLKASLEVTKAEFGEYSISPSEFKDISRKRQVDLVENGKIDVTWEPANSELQDKLNSIKIPIFKGLLGYRLFFINENEIDSFLKINTLDELKSKTMCTGLGWGVTKLYEEEGFKLIVSPAYEGLFEMIEKGRADYFSRGVNEIFTEYKTYSPKYPKLHIESHLALYHPLPFYTYTTKSKKGDLIAKRVEIGVKKLIENGEFDKLFNQYYGDLVKKADISKRKVFRIKNPFLPDDVPFDKKEYWIELK